MGYFTATSRIGYSDMDKNENCELTSIIELMQDVASLHSNSVCYGTEKMYEIRCAWILLNWEIQIIKSPEPDSEVEVRTWVSKYKGFRAIRSFEILDKNNNTLVIANSLWIFYDLALHRPIKAPEELMIGYGEYEKHFFDGENIEVSFDDAVLYENTFCIERRDVDTNGHLNNAKFLDYILAVLPDEIYDKLIFDKFLISYKKQIFKNQNIHIKVQNCGKNFKFTLENELDELCAEGEIIGK